MPPVCYFPEFGPDRKTGAPVAPPTPPGVVRVDLDAWNREWVAAGCPIAPLHTLPPLPIHLVEPDEPAPVGDRWPCHVFWALPPEPLGPVLRPDAGRVSGLPWIRQPDGHWEPFAPDSPPVLSIRPLLDLYGVPVSAQAAMLRRPSWRARLRRLWDGYHEWIAVAVILLLAAAAAAFGPHR